VSSNGSSPCRTQGSEDKEAEAKGNEQEEESKRTLEVGEGKE
jgi:hypothetical protein